MTHQLMTVPFYGNNLLITSVNGQPYTPMKPIVEGMGLDWRSQATKFRSNKDRWGVVMITTPTGGDYQESSCLPLRKLAGWLMTIQPSRVAPEIREKIITYQNECDDVLWDYWTKGTNSRPNDSNETNEQPYPTIKDYLLLNERMNQLPGAQPSAVMDATLTMIQQNTGIQVDALRKAIPHNQTQDNTASASHLKDIPLASVSESTFIKPISNTLIPCFLEDGSDSFEGHRIRIFRNDLGEYWFGGTDVCKAMGYSEPIKTLAKHVPKSQKKRIPVPGGHAGQIMVAVNEVGVHGLIISSLKPKAIEFRNWLYQKIPPTRTSHSQTIEAQQSPDVQRVQTKPLSELKIDGDISPSDIDAWKAFCALPMHTRLLQLHWIARNRHELAVLWSFCEHHRRTATLGAKYFRRESSVKIASKLSDRITCNQMGVSRSMLTLIEEGVLGKNAHVDNVERELWLIWPALSSRLNIAFPELQVLQLNWLAENAAERGVLRMLAYQWINSSAIVDGVRTAPFVKVTFKTVHPHEPTLINERSSSKALDRAITKLSQAGFIELSDHGVMHKARLSSLAFSAMADLMATNFEKDLW
jgi:prophage antirepressor-like protein